MADQQEASCLQRRDRLVSSDKLNLIPKMVGRPENIKFHEDCLYLNLYMPDASRRGGDKWPVYVWIHPGDFSSGTPYLWDPSYFTAKHKVLVVVPAYRLNVFGFFTSRSNDSQGNLGLLDQVAAMEWVKTQVEAFNGSSEQVTLMGHSAGGVSVGLHLLSQRSTGLFSRAVSLSGHPLQPNALWDPGKDGWLEALAHHANCSKHRNLTACLRQADPSALLEFDHPNVTWGPIIDDEFSRQPFLSSHPEVLLLRRTIPSSVPFLCGYVHMEENYSVPKNIDNFYFSDTIRTKIVEYYGMLLDPDMNQGENVSCVVDEELLVSTAKFFYTPSSLSDDPTELRTQLINFITDKMYGASTFKLATLISRHTDTYVYRFDYKIKSPAFTDGQDVDSLGHQFELPFVWGMPYWNNLSFVWNSADKKMADTTMLLFVNFTDFKDPHRSIYWERFTEEKSVILMVGKNTTMGNSFMIDYKSFMFWNDYFPMVVSSSNLCCNSTGATHSSLFMNIYATLGPLILSYQGLHWPLFNL